MKVIFMGTPDFAVPVLQQLLDDGYEVAAVVTQPDRPKGRKKVLTASPVKQLALQYGIDVVQPEKIRNESAVRDVLIYGPDLIVTCAYGQILPESLLSQPKHGCINVHASLLPEYRGGAPIHKAIMDGKTETGVTIMYMVKALDAGDMLAQVKIAIAETDTVGTLHEKLSQAGAELLSKTLPDLLSGRIKPIPQDAGQATVARTIARKDEQIDWSKPGNTIFNHIRGLDPFPGAYTSFKGSIMKIWRAKKVSESDREAKPGTIIAIHDDGFVIQAGDDVTIKVTECQPSGKKRMSAEQFLRGAALNKGDIMV